MPIMPRSKGKAEKIAYKILGVPANMREKTKTAKNRRISKKLYYEDTRLVR